MPSDLRITPYRASCSGFSMISKLAPMEQAMLGRYEKFWTPGQPQLNLRRSQFEHRRHRLRGNRNRPSTARGSPTLVEVTVPYNIALELHGHICRVKKRVPQV